MDFFVKVGARNSPFVPPATERTKEVIAASGPNARFRVKPHHILECLQKVRWTADQREGKSLKCT